ATEDIPQGNTTSKDRRRRSWISREAAFVLLMGEKIQNGQIIPLSEVDSIDLKNKTIELLENLNDSVGFQEGWSFYWEWQLRSQELIHYLVAYDLLKGAGIPDAELELSKQKLQLFTGNLYKRSTDFYDNPALAIIPLEFYSYNPNNHAIITCTTLGVAAIVLSDVESSDENYQPINWINAAMWNLDNTLWREEGLIPRVSDVDRIIGYAEGPNYFEYCFRNAMVFIRSMWNFLPDDSRDYTFYDYNAITGITTSNITRSIRNPWYDENYHNLYEWMNRIRMPDGRYPAIHDSSRAFKTMVTALSGMPQYNIPNPNSNYNSVWVRSQYLSTLIDEGTYNEPLFQALPDAGSLVFRSEYNDPDAVYMHLIGKNGIALEGAKNHHQSDATSFQIYFNGEDLALDPGYSGSTFRADVQKSTDHNLILVNGKGPGTPTSEWIDPSNTTYIENYFDMPSLDYGELRSGWEGADITRKSLFVSDQYFILTDVVRANAQNDYTYQLHGYGLESADASSNSGAFQSDFANFKGTYSRNSSSLLAHVTSRGLTTYSAELDSLSLGSNGYQEYSKMLVHEDNSANTEFLSILYPYKNSAVPTISTVLMDGTVNAQAVYTPNSSDIIFIQPNENLVEIPSSNFNFPHDLKGDGNINFVSFDLDDQFQKLFIENGTQLWIGDDELVRADQSLDLVLEKNDLGEIFGYVSESATIEVFSEKSLVFEYGEISNIEYDSTNQLSIITFDAPSYFKLIEGEIVVSTQTLESDEFSVKVFPNPTLENATVRISNSINQIEGEVSLISYDGSVVFRERID
ncbi:MAG: heparinase II/III family protein, partial [Bacteroidota bacterium]